MKINKIDLYQKKMGRQKRRYTLLQIVKIIDNGLNFYFCFLFYFLLFFSFLLFFYFQNNSGQGLSVTLSHQSQLDGIVMRLIMELRRIKQKELEQSDIIQHRHYMLASYITHGHLGQGAQQLAYFIAQQQLIYGGHTVCLSFLTITLDYL